MGISAAVIVKNEEEVLARMLECVSKWADEIVIVDTGSTDRTVEIAKAHPKVSFYESQFFNKDTNYADFQFNVAKNEAIDRCKEDWVCWWDADDFMDDENGAKVKAIPQGAGMEPALYTFEMQFGGMVFEHCRMFRNGYNIRFDEFHSCHEFLNTLGHPHHQRRDIVIHHRPGKNHSNSAERNLRILEKDYHERGYNDQRTLFYLANSYRESGVPEKAVGFYEKYLEISHWAEERFFARYYKAGCFRALNKNEEARKEYLLCLTEDFSFAEPYSMLGDIALFEGDVARAENWYKMALATPFPKGSRLFAVSQMYDSYPKERLKLIEDNKNKAGNVVENTKLSEVIKDVVIQDAPVVPTGRVVKYNLPSDRREMLLSLCAFDMIAQRNVRVEAVCPDEFSKMIVEKMNTVSASEGEGMKLSLPEDLKGKHGMDWLCRSAGFLPRGVSSFSLNGSTPKTKNKVVICRGTEWGEDNWSSLKDELQSIGVVDVTDVIDFSLIHEVEDAQVFVCEGDWAHHLSKSMGVDTIVVWGKSNPEQNGWPEQENMVPVQNGKLNLISPSSIKECITRRLVNG